MNHFAHWPDTLSRHISPQQTSLYRNLEIAANRHPEKDALYYYGGVTSYAQLQREVDALAGFLQQHCGVAKGDRVALYMQNSPQFIIGFYAILRANAVVVPVNPMNLVGEFRHILEDSGARVTLIGEELCSGAQPLFGDLLDYVIAARYADYLPESTDFPLPAILRDAGADRLDGVVDASSVRSKVVLWSDALTVGAQPSAHLATLSDLAVIPYTSGTTARPKGCVHSHGSAMHVVDACKDWMHMSEQSVALCSLPLFHVTGMQLSMNAPIACGASIAVMTRWDSRCAAQLIERFRATTWVAISTMMVDFMSQPDLDTFDLDSIDCLCGGGAAMPQALAKKIESRWGIPYMEGYGLSETIATTHFNPPDRCKQQCLGIPIQNTESIVVDPETLDVMDVGKTGEILICGPQVFEGYWANVEATREAFVEIAGKRYLRTGDLGYVDEDGYFFMVDRLKRMINASGYKVSPAEVEALLFEHPAIQEACVIGAKDERRGETTKALIVLRAGFDTSAQEIIAWAHERMASYKVPRMVEFVRELPRTGSGKVQWRLLQQREVERAGLSEDFS
ncbi:Acyl-CoA synthetase (AMP-forming)/AMP-acid ligase II [Burkholderia sp. OK233]|nr:Acyl-CoA synthetase (AMP-forming)/AMP-acid ligase II [Burkholderia sp. OK233]